MVRPKAKGYRRRFRAFAVTVLGTEGFAGAHGRGDRLGTNRETNP